MMSLGEYRNRSALLSDFLPWAALVEKGVVLNKDGSFQRTARIRGPDMDSATPAELVGVTVSRKADEQRPKVVAIQQQLAASLELTASAPITLWDEYFGPQYGMPNEEGMEAIKLLARLEGIFLDPVYTGKAMAGLIDGISQKRFRREGPIAFVHTGGSPALFAYHPSV